MNSCYSFLYSNGGSSFILIGMTGMNSRPHLMVCQPPCAHPNSPSSCPSKPAKRPAPPDESSQCPASLIPHNCLLLSPCLAVFLSPSFNPIRDWAEAKHTGESATYSRAWATGQRQPQTQSGYTKTTHGYHTRRDRSIRPVPDLTT